MNKFALIIFLLISTAAHAETFSLDNYKGKVVYLDFWASWCGPCKESFPWLNAIQKKYKDKNFVVVGINLDKDKAKADTFLSEHPAQFPLFFNPDGDLAKKFGVKGMPYSVIIGKDGKEIHSHIGFSAEKSREYASVIERALK